MDSCGGGICFWAVGYAFAYGGDADAGGKTFVGTQGFFLQGDPGIRLENFLFQWAFACAVSSIVAGTVAERMQMKAYLLYSSILAAFVYPVVRIIYGILLYECTGTTFLGCIFFVNGPGIHVVVL